MDKMTVRQAEVSDIESSWNKGAYAETWGLCILDNIRFQAKRVSLSGDNNLIIKPKNIEESAGEVPGFGSYKTSSLREPELYNFGPEPTKINIEGFIYPDKKDNGGSAKELRTKIDELRRICTNSDNLNKNGNGFYTHQLVIPLYKTFYVKIDKYDISTDTTKWGFASFSLTCYITTPNKKRQGWLYADNPTFTEIKKSITNWKDAIKTKFTDKMDVVNNAISTISSFKSAVEINIGLATGLINDAKAWVQNLSDLANISGIVNELSEAASSLIYAPKALANSWIEVLDSFKEIKNEFTNNVDLWKNLYEKNNTLSPDPYTSALNQYNKEVAYGNILDEYIGSEEPEEGENKNFKTEEKLNEAKDTIDEIFSELTENYIYTYDELIALKEMRKNVLDYLNTLDINSVETFYLDQYTPATVASYLKYGDLTHAKNITNLNEDNLFLKGEVKGA